MNKRMRPPSREYSYTGDLRETPLPELLFTIGQYKVPGLLSFKQKQVTKEIYVRDGRILYATSNAKEDHLGEFLFRCGKITRAQLDQSVQSLMRMKVRRQGQLLVEMKALSARELTWAVQSHQQSIVWSLFNWFEGHMQFKLGYLKQKEPILLDLPIPRAILDGVRHIPNAKRIMPYLGSRSTILEVEPDAWLVIELFGADEKEREILKRVDSNTSLYDLCAGTPYGAHETAKILYGLLTLKVIRKKADGIRMFSALPASSF
jgi:hypothetical protein